MRRGLLFAGTENGLYVTLDDGANWLALQTNLPHAPVSWIDIQSHFHDLVVSTYGRGFYILDDISPLEQLNAGALASTVTVFAPPSAYRFRDRQGITNAANSAVQAENGPTGVPITYYVSAALADTFSSATNTPGATCPPATPPAYHQVPPPP